MLLSMAVALLGLAVSAPPSAPNVRVSARIVVIENETFANAGLVYVLLGNDRVQVSANGPRRGKGVRVQVGTHGVRAFLEAVRKSKWMHTESTQQILVMSGAEALISGGQTMVDIVTMRSWGPSLVVIPTVLHDGRVQLQVSTRMEDCTNYGWDCPVAGSSIVESAIIARDGEEVILATSSAVQSTREAGILRWGAGQQGRDMLVVVTAEVQ